MAVVVVAVVDVVADDDVDVVGTKLLPVARRSKVEDITEKAFMVFV